MKLGMGCLILLASLAAVSAEAKIVSFDHVVVIFQENRTPDNLFQGLCRRNDDCSTKPMSKKYDIQTRNWLNNESPSGVTQPQPEPLANHYDLGHAHRDFEAMCNWDRLTAKCRMNGAAGVACLRRCDRQYPQYYYVDYRDGLLDPYLDLVRQYGWANYMFQTNQGPSYAAHQYIFGGTSAPTASDDHQGNFVSENPVGKYSFEEAGCASPRDARIQMINPEGAENPKNTVFPCFEHATAADVLSEHGFTWRYYAPGADTIWTAPNSIKHICVARDEKCTGSAWKADVDIVSSDVLKDVARCKLRNVVWAIPTAQNSDHAGSNTGGGPSWVASIVNAIGKSKCKDGSQSYWKDTAIFITWDDWGGWYDHVAPEVLDYPEGGYQYGFRVPLIVVSAYTPDGYIDDGRYDFGSIIRFIEHNFLIREGALTFADARSHSDLLTFFDLSRSARAFHATQAPLDASHFLNDKLPQLAPDDD
jgi:phospholipase C